ncbi:alpha/beta hydrolase [Gemmobacter sp.]|uniref:alpha/beta hydrolase n=1 Tax=Gemmobacter sp. TaxID=1898957 RepID=UPI002B0018E4|nr:alpha/beta hydrolase [Gemmobacter sp.]
MRAFGKWLGRILLVLVLLGGALWLWPRDSRLAPPAFDAAALPADLDGWLAARESVFTDLVPGTQKRVIWADAPGVKTPLSVVYVHGFSSSSEETRPVPDMLAEALGANLYFTRLAGHGRGAAPLGAASADDWMTDLAEALAIGARIGDRVVVVATSTGASVVLAGLGTPDLRAAMPAADKVAGIAMISPNLRLASAVNGAVLDLPLAERFVPGLIGAEQDWPARNAEHARYWTLRYPTAALFPMAKAMRAARAADPGLVTAPLLVLTSPDDVVVSPAATEEMAAGWGGRVDRESWPLRPGMDHEAHVIAGDIRSPGMTKAVADRITIWAEGL